MGVSKNLSSFPLLVVIVARRDRSRSREERLTQLEVAANPLAPSTSTATKHPLAPVLDTYPLPKLTFEIV